MTASMLIMVVIVAACLALERATRPRHHAVVMVDLTGLVRRRRR